MGEQHGELMREIGRAQALADFYPRLPQRLILGHMPAPYRTRLADWAVERMFRWFLARMERSRPPHLRARTQAFLRAAQADDEVALGFLAMELFENVVGMAGRFGLVGGEQLAASASVPACSSALVWGDASWDGGLRHARNFDFPGIGLWDRAPSVVFCDPPDGVRYGFVTTWGVDVPGVTAFNEAGIVLTTHARFHRDVAFDGVGVVDLGHEIIRRARSLAEAIDIAREHRVMSAWGLAISSAAERRAIVVETSGQDIAIVRPDPDRTYLTCTNRFHSAAMREGEVTGAPGWIAHSSGRERRMTDLVEAGLQRGGLVPDDLEALLADHRDPEDPHLERGCGGILSQPCTVNSIVADGEAGEIRVSVGECPTGWGPFLRIPWTWGSRGAERVDPDACEPEMVGRRHRPAWREGAEGEAYSHYREACRLDGFDRCDGIIREHIDTAARLAPNDPGYRFLAGIFSLREGDTDIACEHFECGLAVEKAAFRRGQLLLWGSRAADVSGRHGCAKAIRAELDRTTHPHLAWHRTWSLREAIHPFPRHKTSRIVPSLLLVDAQ